MAKTKKEMGFIAFNVSMDRKKRIQKMAEEMGLTVSGLMNVAVNEYLKANEVKCDNK